MLFFVMVVFVATYVAIAVVVVVVVVVDLAQMIYLPTNIVANKEFDVDRRDLNRGFVIFH